MEPFSMCSRLEIVGGGSSTPGTGSSPGQGLGGLGSGWHLPTAAGTGSFCKRRMRGGRGCALRICSRCTCGHNTRKPPQKCSRMIGGTPWTLDKRAMPSSVHEATANTQQAPARTWHWNNLSLPPRSPRAGGERDEDQTLCHEAQRRPPSRTEAQDRALGTETPRERPDAAAAAAQGTTQVATGPGWGQGRKHKTRRSDRPCAHGRGRHVEKEAARAQIVGSRGETSHRMGMRTVPGLGCRTKRAHTHLHQVHTGRCTKKTRRVAMTDELVSFWKSVDSVDIESLNKKLVSQAAKDPNFR